MGYAINNKKRTQRSLAPWRTAFWPSADAHRQPAANAVAHAPTRGGALAERAAMVARLRRRSSAAGVLEFVAGARDTGVGAREAGRTGPAAHRGRAARLGRQR